jgi:hypothetical protein
VRVCASLNLHRAVSNRNLWLESMPFPEYQGRNSQFHFVQTLNPSPEP